MGMGIPPRTRPLQWHPLPLLSTFAGFPVTDPSARHQFYTYSNWCYQAGVFVSRSSGTLYQVREGVG